MDYKEKYYKYKKKYLELKNKLSGGYNNELNTTGNKIIELQDGKNIRISKNRFINIINKFQDTKEENIRNKIIIAENEEKINSLTNQVKKLREIFIMNEKLNAIEMKKEF
tara:strand:- start:55 stop:384 length:330 start_codon:yes stop_codon:yes gene_type:complete